MGFQQARAGRVPDCPWCGGTMIPCPELKGRLCCPNDEAVDYRARGERWYFNGQIHPLGEPFPPGPDQEDEYGLDEQTEPEPDDAPDQVSEPSPDARAKASPVSPEPSSSPESSDLSEPAAPTEDRGGLDLDVIAEIESLLQEDREDPEEGSDSW